MALIVSMMKIFSYPEYKSSG